MFSGAQGQHFVLPANFCRPALPNEQLWVSGSAALASGGHWGGEANVVIQPGPPGTASVSVHSDLVGEARYVLDVTCTALSAGNASLTRQAQLFLLGKCCVMLHCTRGTDFRANMPAHCPCSDSPPQVAGSVADQLAAAGTPWAFTIPHDLFSDSITPSSQLLVGGQVRLVSGRSLTGNPADHGLQVEPGVPGEAHVTGIPALVAVGELQVTLTAMDAAGLTATTSFIVHVGPPNTCGPGPQQLSQRAVSEAMDRLQHGLSALQELVLCPFASGALFDGVRCRGASVLSLEMMASCT